MPVFYCPHCNNRLEVDDSFAGRDGWCRKCKNMITVPRRGQIGEESLSPAEKYERLAKAFQHAASKADKYHVMFMRTTEEKEALEEQLQKLLALSDKVASMEHAIRHLGERPETSPPAVPTPETAELSASLDIVRQDVVRLAAELQRERTTRPSPDDSHVSTSTLQSALEERQSLMESAVDRLRDDLEAHHRAAIDANQKLAAVATSAEAANAELEAIRARLDEVASRNREALARSEALESAVATISETSARNAHALETELADVSARLSAFASQIEGITALATHIDEVDATVSRAIEEQGALRASIESMAAALDRLSQFAEEARADAETLRQDIAGNASSLEDAQKDIEDERLARAEMHTDYEHLRAEVDNFADAIQELRKAFEALTAIEALPPDESLEEGALDHLHGDVVTPEVIDENTEAAQQMMLDAFLRFMNSASRGRR